MKKPLRALLTFILFLFAFNVSSVTAKDAAGSVEKKNTTKKYTKVKYTFGVTDAQGCQATLTATPTLICLGSSSTLNLTASGGTTYQYNWATNPSPSTGSPTSYTGASNTQNPSVNPTVTTTYYVTVTVNPNTGGSCQVFRNVVVTVNPAVTANAGTGTSFCSGTCLRLGPAAPGSTGGGGDGGPYNYNWSASPAATFNPNSTSANPSGCPTATTVFTVTVTDGKACTASANVTHSLKTITANIPSPGSICSGQTANICVTAGGGTPPSPTYTYNWASSPGGGISGTATNSCVTANATTTTTYAVTVTESPGCTATASTVLSVGALTVNITGPPEICNGASATLTANPVAGTNTYTWSTGATTSSITVSPGSTTSYTVTVTAGTCTNTASATVSVNPLPVANAGSDAFYCNPGTCVTLGGSGATPTAYNGTPTYTITWSGGTPTPTGANPCVNPTTTTVYTLNVTDSKGCTASDQVTVTAITVTLAPSAAPPSICPGQSSTLSPGTGGNGTGPYGYNWSGPALSSATAANPTVSPTVTSTYYVTATDNNGCTATGSVTVTVLPQPTPTLANAQICSGACTPLDAGSFPGATYTWSPSGAGQINNACPTATTTYFVTVTQGTCSGTASAVVTVNPNPVAMAEPGTAPFAICLGRSFTLGGNAATVPNATATGGTPTYNIVWGTPSPSAGAGTYSPGSGASNPTVTPTANGTYTYPVAITDSRGCTATDDVTLIVNSPPTANAGPDQTLCFNATTTIGLPPTGGTPTYTYAWSPGSNGLNPLNVQSPSLTGNANATYTVLVTDAAGCTATDVVTISVLPAMGATTTYTTATCGNSDGSAIATGSGGSGYYNFVWNTVPAQSASSVSSHTAVNVSGNTYCVTITDANYGCSTTACVVVPNANGPQATITAQTHLSCAGVCTGSATVSVTSGTPNFTYTWSAGPPGPSNTTATTHTQNGLCAGAASVTVTDGNGCQANATVNLTSPTALNLPAPTFTNPSCAGTCDGTATASPTGGTTPYSFSWSNGQTTATATGLCPGTYTVTVTDGNLCAITNTVTIGNPAPIGAVITATTHVSCNAGGNGTATVQASGASGVYAVSWSNSQGAAPLTGTTHTATGLSAGTYNVTVSDYNNGTCLATTSVTITQPPPFNLSQGSQTPAPCGGNGSTCVTVTGATPTYSYNWSSGAGTSSCITSTAGSYVCTITDAQNCTATFSSIIPSVGGPTVTVTYVFYPTGPSFNNGQICVDVTGGTPTYNLVWSPAPAAAQGNTVCVTGLTPNTYCVNVVDAAGCPSAVCATITAPPPVSVALAMTPVSCNGGSNGTVTATASNGSAPYTYNWSPSNPSFIADCIATPGTCSGNALLPGTYTVTVTDNALSTASASIVVTQPAQPLTAIISPTHVSCFGTSTGALTATASGGTQFPTSNKYTFAWSSPPGGSGTIAGSQSTISNLAANNYTVTVTDFNNCTFATSLIITQPAVLNVTATKINDISCFGYNDARIRLTYVSGGVPTCSYTWSPTGYAGTIGSTPGSSVTVSNIGPAGNHCVTVTDAAGCTQNTCITITAPGGMSFTTAFTPALCSTGSATACITRTGGGTAPYTYQWSPPATMTSSSSTGTCASGLTLAGNPYTVTVTDGNLCQQTVSLTITAPPALATPTVTTTAATCFYTSDGSATATSGGGTTPYTYQWSPAPAPVGPQTGNTVTGLSNGTYFVTVYDANNCPSPSTSFVITRPTQVTATITSPTHVSCFGTATGSATVQAGGGNNPPAQYSYLWSNGQNSGGLINSTTHTAVSMTGSAGAGSQYTVTVTDSRGCTATTFTNITEPSQLSVNPTSVTHLQCFGVPTGAVTVNANGGTQFSTPNKYTFAWSAGGPGADVGTQSTINNLPAGTYTVSVTDNNNCVATTSAIITQPLQLDANITAKSDPTCDYRSDGSMTVTVVAGTGTPSYTYSWNNGQTTATATGLSASASPGTTYTVIITDNNGCSISRSDVLNNPLAVTNSPSVIGAGATTGNKLCISQPASLIVTPGGGTGSYTYNWQAITSGQSNPTPSNSQNPTATPTVDAQYSVTVTDVPNGCTAVATVNVYVNPPLNVNVVTNSFTICLGETATLSANGGGGNGNITYTWNPGNYVGQQYPVIGTTANSTTTYTVVASDNCGTNPTPSDQAVVRVSPTPNTAVTYSGPTCTPLNASFYTSTSNLPGSSYTWNFDDGSQVTNSGDVSHVFNYAPTNGGIYDVTVTVSNPAPEKACPRSGTISVQAYQIPTAEISLTSDIVTDLNSEAEFRVDHQQTDPADPDRTVYDFSSIEWSFSDDNRVDRFKTGQTITHDFPTKGTYTAYVTLASVNGCTAQDTLTFLVEGETLFWVPDAFTPNGDGNNDSFKPKGVNITEFEMHIYDRWGNLIFHTIDINEGWDGRAHNGNDLAQQDIYVYRIVYVDFRGERSKPLIGKVSLIR